MENLTQKSPEKLRQERLNYLQSQIIILGQQIEQIRETEEYIHAKELYDTGYRIARDERDIALGFLHFEKNNDKAQENDVHDEFLKKKNNLEMIFNHSEPMIKITNLQKQIKDFETEQETLRNEKNNEDENRFQEQLIQLRKETELLTEKVFNTLDVLENEHVKPLMDLGIEINGALEALRTNNLSVYGKIVSLRNNLSELDRVTELLERIKNRYTYNASKDMEQIENVLERIKGSIE